MRPFPAPLVLLVLAVTLGACRWAKAPPLAEGNVPSTVAETPPSAVRLGPGDRISVVVFNHPESSTGELGTLLDSEGRVDLPPIGPVSLAGLTPEEARLRLREEFARFLRTPTVAFNVLELRARRVYIFGEVERPGAYPLDRSLNALQALTLAGAFRPGADRKQVALLRGERDQLQVYFFNGATPGPDGLVAVQPDDFLFVRLSGAGTFRDQVLPIVQSLVPPITGFASLLVVADQLNE